MVAEEEWCSEGRGEFCLHLWEEGRFLLKYVRSLGFKFLLLKRCSSCKDENLEQKPRLTSLVPTFFKNFRNHQIVTGIIFYFSSTVDRFCIYFLEIDSNSKIYIYLFVTSM